MPFSKPSLVLKCRNCELEFDTSWCGGDWKDCVVIVYVAGPPPGWDGISDTVVGEHEVY